MQTGSNDHLQFQTEWKINKTAHMFTHEKKKFESMHTLNSEQQSQIDRFVFKLCCFNYRTIFRSFVLFINLEEIERKYFNGIHYFIPS